MDRVVISRRALLGTAVGVASAMQAGLIRPAQAQTTGVTPIFIRWDAWYDRDAVVTRQYHATLSPQRWQSRAPWFSTVVSPYRITVAGTQANMDTEIEIAANAGIKAFGQVWYGGGVDNNPPGDAALHKGWQLYNTSSQKALVKWCGIVSPRVVGHNPWSNTAGWHANVDQWVTYFQQTNYLKWGTRPVLFVIWDAADVATYFGGSNANVTTSFNYLRSQSIAAGAGDPYIVAMGDPYGGGLTSSAVLPLIAGNAISNYVPNIFNTALPNSAADLYALTSNFWAANVATGNKTVPNAILGWDARPRVQLPPFGSGRVPWIGNDQHYVPGTNAEIAAHLQSCITFIGANQPACDNKLMLVYAWNEFDEGGSAACPTLGDPPAGSPPTTSFADGD